MRSRRFALLLVLLPLSCLIAFFGVSIDCSAAYEGGEFMTPTDFRDILGDDITFTYFNGTTYEEGHFIYLNYKTSGLTMSDSDYSNLGTQPYLLYTCSSHSAINSNPGYITVSLSPRFSVTDTFTISSFVALASNATSVASDVYSDSRWDWHFCGSDVHFLAPSYEGNDVNSTLWTGGSSRPPSICIPASMSSDSLTSGYSLDVKFYGASASRNSQIYLAIGVPYISDAAQVVEGTLPPDSGGNTGDINVNVDLSETNGLLGSIADTISDLGTSIVDGISGLFIPDEDDIEDFKDTLSDILSDTFGGIPDLEDDLIDTIDSIFTTTATSSVHFEGIAIPNGSGGYTSIVAPQDVSLKPDGYTSLFNFAKTLINIVATIATFNTLRHIKDKVIVGEVIIDAD